MQVKRRFEALASVALSANRTGTELDCAAVGVGSIQVLWDSLSATDAVAKIQVSNDRTNWSDLSGATLTLASASGNGFIHLAQPTANYLRLVVTKNTVASGTVSAVGFFQGGGL
jgi:hypothetical protein